MSSVVPVDSNGEFVVREEVDPNDQSKRYCVYTNGGSDGQCFSSKDTAITLMNTLAKKKRDEKAANEAARQKSAQAHAAEDAAETDPVEAADTEGEIETGEETPPVEQPAP